MERKNERLQGDSWLYFNDALKGLDENTSDQYLKRFIEFLEFYDYTTETLFNEQLAASKADDPRKKKLIPMKVVQFQEKLIENGLKSGSTMNVEKALRKFFKANELDFKINGNKIVSESDEIPGITKAQLKQIFDLTGSVRMKTIIVMARDSGLRIGDLCNLKIKEFDPVITNPKLEFHTIEITQEKLRGTAKRLKANPVFGPESLYWLRKWISERDKIKTDSEFLFVNVKDVQEHIQSKGQKHKKTNKGDKVDSANISVIFRQLRDKSGLKETGVSIHSLRKMFKTSLEYVGVQTSWVNKFSGRKGEGTGGIYLKPVPEELINVYKNAYSALSFGEETNIEKIESIEEQNRILQNRIRELEESQHSEASIKNMVLRILAENAPGTLTSLEIKKNLERSDITISTEIDKRK